MYPRGPGSTCAFLRLGVRLGVTRTFRGRVALHDLRHGRGTLLISFGVKPRLVQTILRHSRLATTMDLYVHAYDEDLREAVGTLDRALGGGA